MAISGYQLSQHPLFWESMVWQSVILALLFALTSPWITRSKSRLSKAAFWVLPPAIFALVWRVELTVFFIYTVVWVACAPQYVSRRVGWLCLLVVCSIWYTVRLLLWPDSQPLMQTLLEATFHMFALISSMAAKESALSNDKTQKLNRDLLATQHLLGEASRESERTRIARDLHDLLGHHLTALTINLQVAGRVSDGLAKEKIEHCHALSKLLLSDVREAVSTLRDMPVVDLRELLELTVRDIPRLKVSLIIDEEMQLDDVNTAEVFLRLVQEAITNSLKHSEARAASINVNQTDGRVVLTYTDDGGGCEALQLGNGLTGMKERIERIGGRLKITSTPTFNLIATTPVVN